MFTNLVESSSHRREFTRRGSFLLLTTASYAVSFVIAGVASIYAYDAKLSQQNLELVTLMRITDFPVPTTPAEQPPKPTTPRDNDSGDNTLDHYIRRDAVARTDQPNLVPDKVSSEANPSLPMPKHGIVEFGSRDANPGPGLIPGDNTTSTGIAKPAVEIAETQPPPPDLKPVPRIVRKSVITGDAISLPKPPYPLIAKKAGAQGEVVVQVLVDESGRVVSAKVVKGHPLLSAAAQSAAYQARFGPTMIGDQPVKVSGMITYNFLLN